MPRKVSLRFHLYNGDGIGLSKLYISKTTSPTADNIIPPKRRVFSFSHNDSIHLEEKIETKSKNKIPNAAKGIEESGIPQPERDF